MCGIVGYVGERNSLDVLMGGLRRLEYRGYDSAGVAVVDDEGDLETAKRAGKLQVLADELERHPIHRGGTGIGRGSPGGRCRNGTGTPVARIATGRQTSRTESGQSSRVIAAHRVGTPVPVYQSGQNWM